MNKALSKAVICRPEAIGIRQLSAEISLGFRSPIVIRAGKVHGGIPGELLSGMYAAIQAYNKAVATGKGSRCGRT